MDGMMMVVEGKEGTGGKSARRGIIYFLELTLKSSCSIPTPSTRKARDWNLPPSFKFTAGEGGSVHRAGELRSRRYEDKQEKAPFDRSRTSLRPLIAPYGSLASTWQILSQASFGFRIAL